MYISRTPRVPLRSATVSRGALYRWQRIEHRSPTDFYWAGTTPQCRPTNIVRREDPSGSIQHSPSTCFILFIPTPPTGNSERHRANRNNSRLAVIRANRRGVRHDLPPPSDVLSSLVGARTLYVKIQAQSQNPFVLPVTNHRRSFRPRSGRYGHNSRYGEQPLDPRTVLE